MLRFLVFLCVFWNVECGFFDLTDIDDPLALFWNTKNAIEAKGTCTATNNDGEKTEGKCIHVTKCLFTGGTPNGICGLGGTCCTYTKGCNKETKEKISYFSGNYHSIKNFIQTNLCTYKVNLLPNTCQLRLDFEQFLFNPPQWNDNSKTYRCSLDSMTILPNYYNLPILCGNNNKQHAYVHLNRSIDSAVTLSVALADQSDNNVRFQVNNPSWKIKVTQLECESKMDVFHHDEKSMKEDRLMLAPLGAIQYFTQMSGNFRSFGLDENVSSADPIKIENDPFTYINNLGYAIAFKRYPSICGVRFTPLYMAFGDTTPSTCTTDYIFAPEARTDSKWCDAKEASIYPPGPLYIYFKSPATYSAAHTMTWGFNVNYHLESCSSQIINNNNAQKN